MWSIKYRALKGWMWNSTPRYGCAGRPITTGIRVAWSCDSEVLERVIFIFFDNGFWMNQERGRQAERGACIFTRSGYQELKRSTYFIHSFSILAVTDD